MNRYPPKVAAALQRNLIDRAHPLVLSVDADGQVRELQGDAAHYGHVDGDVRALLRLVDDMLVGADRQSPCYWPLVAIAHGHHVALQWIPDQPFDHIVITDSDVCNAELTERQQAANELALSSMEKSRTIRELKKARIELEQRSRVLTETQLFQRRLIDTLAHDLRTPLTSISGYAALLEPYLKDDLALHRALGAIQRNAVYLKSLAENLLELARHGHPETHIQRHAFALDDLARDVETIVRPMADGKGLALTVSASSSAHRSPFYDQLKLQQILINLLSNAVRYTPTGRVEANLDWDGKTLSLVVSDTGIGIAAEYQKRVFEPLNRGAQQGREGAGLGLSIVQQLVESMGGTLHLQSVLGVGTRIEVRLPEEAPEMIGPPIVRPSDEPDLTLHNRRVLIIDDDVDICELLVWSLRDAGYEPEMLSDPSLAEARVASFDPALVVIDVDLGARSGLAITQELRLRRFAGAIIVFSGASDTLTRQSAEKAGANAFLPKPLDLRRFLSWMQKLRPSK